MGFPAFVAGCIWRRCGENHFKGELVYSKREAIPLGQPAEFECDSEPKSKGKAKAKGKAKGQKRKAAEMDQEDAGGCENKDADEDQEQEEEDIWDPLNDGEENIG